jgi:hypothetical protein
MAHNNLWWCKEKETTTPVSNTPNSNINCEFELKLKYEAALQVIQETVGRMQELERVCAELRQNNQELQRKLYKTPTLDVPSILDGAPDFL